MSAGAIARWVAITTLSLALLLGVMLLLMDTSVGHRFISNRLGAYETASGMTFRVKRIEGSIYGRMSLLGVTVSDPAGVFVSAPEIDVDWRPFAYLRGLVDLRDVSTEFVRLHRLPQLRPAPTKENAPILPDVDLRLGRLHVGRLVLDQSITGRRHALRVDGSAHIADRRAQIAMDVAALRALGLAGGDVVSVRLDAVPAENRLRFDVVLSAPVGGFVDSALALGKPFNLAIGGRGDWRAWSGAARATLGTQRVGELAIAEHNGKVRLHGTLQPALFMSGPAARLALPRLMINAEAALAQRRINLDARARSGAIAADAHGLLDLGESRFGGFQVDVRLLTPGSIATNLAGRDVALSLVLDGPFGRPAIAYRLTADSISFGATGVERLSVQGRAMSEADQILVPVHAIAQRVTGLNAAAGASLTNLKIDGDLAYQRGKLISDGLKLRSDRIDATAIIIADIANGVYTGALKGRVNHYQVDGLGRIALVTNAHLTTTPGGYRIRGRVRVVTQRIDNASVAGLLGGRAVITANVGYDPTSGATLQNLRMDAPSFHISQGQGSWRSRDGQIAFQARGRSNRYGPLAVTVSGTAARPLVHLKAAHPTIGLRLSNVDAEVTGIGGGYRIRARGGSPYGPFIADLTSSAAGGSTRLDIDRAMFAGVDIAGRLTRSGAGPYLGTLTLRSRGLNGSVRLSGAGRIQRAEVAVDARSARIPGTPPIIIGSGRLRATALLYPGRPSLRGEFRITDLTQGNFILSRGQAGLSYQNGAGTFGLVASGQSKVPFDLAMRAAIAPGRIRANLRGTADGLAFRLAAPAAVIRSDTVWRLQPTTILLPRGQLQVEGSYGKAVNLSAMLRGVDLSLLEAFVPGYGLSGKASGRVTMSTDGSSLPTVDARLDVAGLTRTGAETVSTPVDVALLAHLGGVQGKLAAIARRGGTIIGRLTATIGPIPAGGTTSQRLLEAPLTGGIRYSGPAEVLWTLSGVTGQDVTGPIAIGVDFGGRLGEPTLVGVVRADKLTYVNASYGTKITGIAARGRFTRSRLTLLSLTGRAGEGTIAAAGSIGLDAASGFPIDLRVALDGAQLARSDALGAKGTGTITVTHRKTGGVISGDLRIPEARYQILRQGAAEVVDLSGIRRKNSPPAETSAPELPSNWKLDLRLRAPNSLYVSGMGLEAEWRANLRIAGSSNKPRVIGSLEVVRGTYSFAGKRFDIDHGNVRFQGGKSVDPTLDIAASTTIDDLSAGIAITGTARQPRIVFTSTPALPQDEVLSRILFGQSLTSLSPLQAVQLAAALNSLRGSGGGLNPLGKLRSALGIDRLRILGADEATGRGTAIGAGKHLGKNIYIEVVTDARGFTATQLEISLSKALSILSQTSSFGASNVSIRYKKEY